MRVSEAKSWQEGLPKPFVWPRESPANTQCLTAMAYKFQEFLVTAVWSQKKGYNTFVSSVQYTSFCCVPLPPASLPCNIKMGRACNTDIRHNIVKLCCLSFNHYVMMSQSVKRKNLTSLETKILTSACGVRNNHLLCTDSNLCILVKHIFWKTSRIWSSSTIKRWWLFHFPWQFDLGEKIKQEWKAENSVEPKDFFGLGFFFIILFLIRQINHWNKKFLKDFVFSHVAFITDMVSAQELLVLPTLSHVLRKQRAWAVRKFLCVSGSCFSVSDWRTYVRPCCILSAWLQIPPFSSWSVATFSRHISMLL